MQKFYLLIAFVAALAGCEDLSQQQLVGTTGGAVVGAVVTPNNPLQGAVIGSAVGLAAGTYFGRDPNGRCIYQRNDGSRYLANCP
jgi:hypothetical protein